MDPRLKFIDPEPLQHKLRAAEKTIESLQEKINKVPPEKILKFLLIGAAGASAIFFIYISVKKRSFNQEK